MLCQMFVGTSFPRLFHQDLQIIFTSNCQAKNTTPKMSITIKLQHVTPAPQNFRIALLMMWRHVVAIWTFSGLLAVAQPGVAWTPMGFFFRNWVVVSNIFYFHPPPLGKWSKLTNIFQRGWNQQLEKLHAFLVESWYCWWLKSGDHQLRLVVEIPLFTRFYASQVVVWDFFQQQYRIYLEPCRKVHYLKRCLCHLCLYFKG